MVERFGSITERSLQYYHRQKSSALEPGHRNTILYCTNTNHVHQALHCSNRVKRNECGHKKNDTYKDLDFTCSSDSASRHGLIHPILRGHNAQWYDYGGVNGQDCVDLDGNVLRRERSSFIWMSSIYGQPGVHIDPGHINKSFCRALAAKC